jgi:hypothetical protein
VNVVGYKNVKVHAELTTEINKGMATNGIELGVE